MGREYYYCSRCQSRLNSDDFETGDAVRVRDQIACGGCLGEIIAPLSFKEQEQILVQIKNARDQRAQRPPAPAAPRSGSGTALRVPAVPRPSSPSAAPRPAPANHTGLVFFIGAVALLGALAVLYFLVGSHELSDSKTPPPPVTAAANEPGVKVYATKGEPAVKPVVESKKESAAKAALDKAREAVKAKAPFAEQVDLHRKALFECEGSSLAGAAKKELEEVQLKLKDLVVMDLASIDQEVRAAVEKEEFGRAIDLLEKARLRHSSGEWTTGIDMRVRDVNVKDAWKAFLPLRDKALDAKHRKAEAELKAIADRVAKWGIPAFSKELDRSLATPGGADATPPSVPPTPSDLKPLSEEAKTYQKLWQDALAFAGLRDYEAALAALERAGAPLTEADLKAEAQADQALLKLAAAAWREAVQALSAAPRGEKLSLEYLDELNIPVKISEPVVRADRAGVEVLRGGEPFLVELSELTARCLGDAFKRRADRKPETDNKAAAFLCLLEADVDGARALLAGPSDQIPWKYWSYAARLAETRFNPATESARKEVAARKIYFAAERERRQVRTRGAAIEKYRALLNEYADTALVRVKRAHLSAQRETGKEYVFLSDDLAGAGTFKPSRHPKAGPCWTSDADSPDERGRENTIDFSFYAFPDAPYRCWVYAGGCCLETFASYLQTTDLTYTDPKTRQVYSVDPGSGVSLPVSHSIFLKQRHDQHGGPKEPKRWEWISIPLPKYAAAGLKTVRLLTQSKGFSVAHAVVSAARTMPPGDAEMKALVKGPADVADTPGPAVPAAEPRDPALVGHWKLDEAGGTATDASGNDNTGILVGDPPRGPGKAGLAILLDGKDRYVNLPTSPTLEKVQEGNFTIAAWIRPNSRPAGAEPSANDGAYAVLMKAGVEGLKYGADQKFTMNHALGNNTGLSAVAPGTSPPGGFHHVAGVVSRTEGSLRLYVNGKLESTVTFAANAVAHEFGAETWKIGIGAPGAQTGRWAADGALDDVRIYARALTANDVRILSGAAAQGPLAVTLSSPAPSERFDAGATVTMSAAVAGGDGRVAKVEFYQGSHLLGADTVAPWVYGWRSVSSGMYTLTARATDKAGAVYVSAPVTIRVGNAELYRAINLGGAAVKIDGLPFEAKNARNLAVKGEPVDKLEAELIPPADPARGAMLRAYVHAKEGTSVALNPVPNGSYQVYLYVVEDAASETFDLLIRGKVVLSKYASGPAGRWERLGPWFVDVTDGVIDVSARGGDANFCGLEIWRVTK